MLTTVSPSTVEEHPVLKALAMKLLLQKQVLVETKELLGQLYALPKVKARRVMPSGCIKKHHDIFAQPGPNEGSTA
jgi:hypothetical protein